jgi:hypothetical protein
LAIKVAPLLIGRQIAANRSLPAVILAVPTVKIMSSSVTIIGKLVAVSAASAAGVAIQLKNWCTALAVVEAINPVDKVGVPKDIVAPDPTKRFSQKV